MKKWLSSVLIVVGLFVALPASAALPSTNIVATTDGSTVSITVTPLASDMGQNGIYYLAAVTPSGSTVYFYDGSKWTAVDLAKSQPPSFASGKLQATSVSAGVKELGTVGVYVGYGTSFNDLVQGNKFGLATTVKGQTTTTTTTTTTPSGISVTGTKSGTTYTAKLTILGTDQGLNGA